MADDFTVEEAPDRFQVEDNAGAFLDCGQCGGTFPRPPGRGRPPSKCPDCREAKAGKGSGAREAAPKRANAVTIAKLEANLHGQLTMLGMGLMFVDPFDAQIVMSKAEKAAKVLANLAATNPSIRKGLERGVEMAGWGPVLLLLAEIGVPIAAHHGLIKGVPDPATRPQRQRPAAPGYVPPMHTANGSMASADPLVGVL